MKARILVMGSFVADLMGRGPKIPGIGETIKGDFFRIGPGGKGGNQAVAAARAGGETAMITKLGRDAFGDMAIASFEAEGIDTTFSYRSEEHPTGAALILVDAVSGDNSILVIPGACGHIAAEEADSAIRSFPAAEILVLQLETNFEAFAASLEAGRELGLKVICNPAPAAHIPAEHYASIDYLTPNETEASVLSGLPVGNEEEAAAAARKLRGMGARNVIITLGEKGALVLDEAGNQTHVPPFMVEAIDTTGAGDSFNGALAVAVSEGKGIVEATVFAAAAAALSVTKLGTAPAMPRRAEIEALIRSQARS
jgi:ribokinase